MKLVAWNTLLTAILGLAVLGRRINAYCRKSALHPNAEYNRFVTAQLAPRLEAIVAAAGHQPDAEFQK